MSELEARADIAGGEYAIHGTNAPNSVGGFVSYGCIRMYNQDVLDLYPRVNVGAKVTVTWNKFSSEPAVASDNEDEPVAKPKARFSRFGCLRPTSSAGRLPAKSAC